MSFPPAVQADWTQEQLSVDDRGRYSRHLLIPEVAIDGQRKLKASRVLIVGTGGLGSPAALYLAAAGVGTIGLVDADVIDTSNLQRQVLYGTSQLGQKKLEMAKARLQDLNPNVNVVLHDTWLTSQNALEIVGQYDIVLDGTDNFPTRYLVNDACVLAGVPNVYGSIFRFEGQVSVFWAAQGPCYRCLYATPPPPGLVPSCAEGGVLGVLPGVVGTLQATEAIKVLLGIGTPLVGRLLLYDALHLSIEEVKLRKNPHCVVCGPNPSIKALIDYEEFCGMPGAEGGQVQAGVPEITAAELNVQLQNGHPPLVLDVREPTEAAICSIPGAPLVPMGQLAQRIDELPKDRPIVAYCRSGLRSAQATRFLRDKGLNVVNLHGGILAWIDDVDPGQARY